MIKSERQREIFRALTERGFCSVKELAELLYTSESSIRRDLTAMAREGIVRRSHGGAESVSVSTGVMPFEVRSYKNNEAKQLIAKKAVSLINEGDTVFLDQSSTSYFLALLLMDFKSLTVVTNNIEIVSLLSHTSHSVHCTGGVISHRNANCLIGESVSAAFSSVYADIAFFSARSLSDDGVISEPTVEETYVRNAMLRNSKKRVFLCDGSKVGGRSPFKQCTLADVDFAITDKDALDSFRDKFKELTVL